MTNFSKDIIQFIEFLDNKKIESKDEFEQMLTDFLNQEKALNPTEFSNKEKSRELVEKACNVEHDEAVELLKKAITLDPENLEALNMLAYNSYDILQSIVYYKSCITIFEKNHDQQYFDDNKGELWLDYVARFYLQALFGLGNCYYNTNDFENAIATYKKTLKHDNIDYQNIRNKLSSLFLKQRFFDEYLQLFANFKDDKSAAWLYNHALYSFLTEGVSEITNKILQSAILSNKFVFQVLMGTLAISDFEDLENFEPGSKDEAFAYIIENRELLESIKGLKNWAENFKS